MVFVDAPRIVVGDLPVDRSGSDSTVSCSLATFGPATPSTIGKPYIEARWPPLPCSQMKTGQRSGA